MSISPLAGHPAPASMLLDVSRLVTAYYTGVPDPAVPAQRVTFGTSGHRGSAFDTPFNEWHVAAITESICRYRKREGIDGLAEHDEYTPTPVVSHAIICHNRGLTTGLADGIVITPSHNPPDNGGFKYNPPTGGPAGTTVTRWIETVANDLLGHVLHDVKRVPHARALRAATTHRHDYLNSYVRDLCNIVDLDAVRGAGIRLGVDPLRGAGVHYSAPIAAHYRLDLTVVSDVVDQTFRFMTLDWDGRIRMDPSSTYAMQRLIGLKDTFDVAFACDTDHDRHGVVTPTAGLLPSTHYLTVAIDYLFRHRPEWRAEAGVCKTMGSSTTIDRVIRKLGRRLHIYKIYGESFRGRDHLDRIIAEAQAIVDKALEAAPAGAEANQ